VFPVSFALQILPSVPPSQTASILDVPSRQKYVDEAYGLTLHRHFLFITRMMEEKLLEGNLNRQSFHLNGCFPRNVKSGTLVAMKVLINTSLGTTASALGKLEQITAQCSGAQSYRQINQDAFKTLVVHAVSLG
jgi:hypothetical protein